MKRLLLMAPACWPAIVLASTALAPPPAPPEAPALPAPSLREEPPDALFCGPEHTACCAPEATRIVPGLRGMLPGKARQRLRDAGLAMARVVERPTDGTAAGLVMESNPRGGVRVCQSTPIWLYVVEPPKPLQKPGARLRNFHGDTTPQALGHLVGELAGRFSFTSCGHRLPEGFDAGSGEWRVSGQMPAEGTELAAAWQGQLALTPASDFWYGLVGTTAAEARRRTEGSWSGWQVRRFDGKPLDPADGALTVIAATGDREACGVALLLAHQAAAPPTAAPPDCEASGSCAPPRPEPPDPPRSPALPLAGGALGGLLLARTLWPRERESAATTALAAPLPPALPDWVRVVRDTPTARTPDPPVNP